MLAKLNEKMNWMADARWVQVMARRAHEGKSTTTATSVFAVVFSLVNRSDQDGLCHPSLELIAEESSTSVPTVKRVIEILIEEGVVTRESRNRIPGVAKSGSMNHYKISWQGLQECGHGRTKTRINLSPDSGISLSRESTDHGSADDRSRLKNEEITAQNQSRYMEGTSHEPLREPPPTPHVPTPTVEAETKTEGGGNSDSAWAQKIQHALPSSKADDVEAADFRAAADAIKLERTNPDGITPEEIFVAATAYRKAVEGGYPAKPLRRRVWLRERGYVGLILEERTRASVAGREKTNGRAAETHRLLATNRDMVQDLEHERDRAFCVLQALPEATIADLRAMAIAATPLGAMKTRWATANWRSSQFLRDAMMRALESREAVAS